MSVVPRTSTVERLRGVVSVRDRVARAKWERDWRDMHLRNITSVEPEADRAVARARVGSSRWAKAMKRLNCIVADRIHFEGGGR